jgi:hypothetical protein
MKFDLELYLHHTPQLLIRFWTKVNVGGVDDCWEWTASRHHKGYGEFHCPGICAARKCVKASRMAWLISFGEIPDKFLVCHRCDNPSCCNPSHLFLGTDGDNTRDSVSKGRFVSTKRGETHTKSVFTNLEVIEMRELFKTGRYRIKDLAERYGKTSTLICSVVYRKTWKHI